MIETILLAKDRKTGKDVLLCGREVPMREQVELYKELAGPTSEEFSDALFAQLVPHKKRLRFVTSDEVKRREKVQAEAEAKAKAESEAATQSQPESSGLEQPKTKKKGKKQ